MADFEWGPNTVMGSLGDMLDREIHNLIIGKRLGAGAYREVFVNKQNKKEVIKIEQGSRCFSNIHENNLWWLASHDDELSKWMAPVVDISPTGSILIMKRTKPVSMQDMPKRVPNIFADFKIENWGWYKGRVVCHDYGNHMAIEKGINNWKMKKVEWWSMHD